jgi:hypothetical protein
LEEQHALAHRTFVAFDVNEEGGVETAVIRGEAQSSYAQQAEGAQAQRSSRSLASCGRKLLRKAG